MKDYSNIERRLETRLSWLAVVLVSLSVAMQNWYPVLLFILLAMVLEYFMKRVSPGDRGPGE